MLLPRHLLCIVMALTGKVAIGEIAIGDNGADSPSLQTPAISIATTPSGKRVLIDDELFAEYLTDTGRQPAVWPINGPIGIAMTRSWPLGPRQPTEEIDHPHHESLWFSHGGVNGHDFWAVAKDKPKTHIVHKAFLRTEVGADSATIETANDWTAGGETIIADTRRLTFGLLGETADSPRYIDFQIKLIASEGPATFADTKEGAFGVRVSGPLTVDTKLSSGLKGKIRNSRGETNDKAWGKPAEWVDYSGPLTTSCDEKPPTGGIIIMSHPDSFRPVCRWHVRTYGLFAANPFGGVKDFPQGEPAQGAVTLDEGNTLTLNYRVVFYAGSVEADTIRQWFDAFAGTTAD
jgi:hypothetical protein